MSESKPTTSRRGESTPSSQAPSNRTKDLVLGTSMSKFSTYHDILGQHKRDVSSGVERLASLQRLADEYGPSNVERAIKGVDFSAPYTARFGDSSVYDL